MEKSFTAKQLSEAFEIPVARWKRWAREFIGIDPIAGRFGGVPREFDEEQSFYIFLAGVLVSDLLFSIPEANSIIKRLKPWFKERGLWPGSKATKTYKAWDDAKYFRVYIYREATRGFSFKVEGTIRLRMIQYNGHTVEEHTFIEELLPDPVGTATIIQNVAVQRVLEVSVIKSLFDLNIKTLEEKP